ncbi:MULTISPECIES: lipoprotein NlpI [Vibrio]|uniref:Lipoprotein NlpI n=1 Tax=Vibrio bivalvicida TaxID=1276888 RepID=A0A177XV26_9VIBR|nr:MULTISPECIES: lipoprotein NlpI [Vibrio]KLN67130.1 lipoprotein NlpI [Vibrio sp. VPAP30]OAJ92206.1 lipoprotein NlpI [Vibrio bivalvicida]
MKWFQTATLSLALLVTAGCVSTSNQQAEWVLPPMVEALQPSLQQEVQIARLSQLLGRTDLPNETRAKILYERGNYYDSVGLRNLARLDYEQSLAIYPAQADLFNLLGVYFTEKRNFDAAYDAFDSALELAPNNSYAARNRAIALYYGGRFDLALEEMQQQYDQDSSDPFSALWLYIIKSKVSPEMAKQELEQSYQNRNDKWGWIMVALTLGELSEKQAFKAIVESTRDKVVLAQHLTEAYFYLGKRYQEGDSERDIAKAISFYRLAISFNVFEYVEHRYAILELTNIYEDLQAQVIARAKAQQAANRLD